MPIQRSSVLKGPAVIQMGGQSIYTADDIKIVTQIETFNVQVSTAGKADERYKDIITKLTFTPAGEWEAGLLSLFFPHTNPSFGSSLLGASDVPVVVHPTNGTEKLTYKAGAITKMPQVVLSATKTAFGSMEITCLGADNTAWSNSARIVAVTASEAFSDSNFAVSNVKTVPYSASLSGVAAPWNDIRSREGFVIDFSMNIEPVIVDGEGTIDFTLTGLDVNVKFAPVNLTVAQIITQLKIQGSGVAQGVSLAANAADLVITGGSGLPEVTIYKVALKQHPHVYGLNAMRHEDLELIATRPTGSGAMFAVGTAA